MSLNDLARQAQRKRDADARADSGAQLDDEPLPPAVRAIDVNGADAVEIRAGTMTAGDLGLYVGEDGAMKTALLEHLMGATAGGYRYLGRFGTTAAACLLISEEDDARVIRNRIEAFCRGHGWDIETVLSNVHIIAKAGVELTSAQWLAHIRAEVLRIRPAIIGIDPWAEVITGEENSNSEARPIIKAMRALTALYGANVIIVAHLGKPVDGRKTADLIRGATAPRRASRFTYSVVHDDQARELTVTCLKMSRCEKPAPFVVRYFIDSDPDNRASWRSARFEYVTTQTAALDRADRFIIEQIKAGDRMNTTQLKDAAKGTGVSGADISRALKVLEMRRKIDFEEGAKGSKMWGLVCLPSDVGQPGQPEVLVARQPECLPGNPISARSACLAPLGASRNGAESEAFEQESSR